MLIPRAFIIDKDGTIVNQSSVLPGAAAFLQMLQQKEIPYLILSNTGEKTAKEVASTLSQILFLPISVANVFTARDNLYNDLRDTKKHVRVVGKAFPDWPLFDVDEKMPEDCEDVCIAVCSDGEIDNFLHTVIAVAEWVRHGAEVVTTSQDEQVAFTNRRGQTMRRPGPGVFLNAVSCTAGVQVPHRSYGKPSSEIGGRAMQMLCKQGYSDTPQNVMIIGDRIDTDMKLGNMNKWLTCLVETGCHTLDRDAITFPRIKISTTAASLNEVQKNFVDSDTEDKHRQRSCALFCSQPRHVRSVPNNLNELT